MKGMLWRNDAKGITTEEKIRAVAAHYQKKNGQFPTLCYMNPAELPNAVTVDGIKVEPYRFILPGHILAGVEHGLDQC
jgi:hypothetical protein